LLIIIINNVFFEVFFSNNLQFRIMFASGGCIATALHEYCFPVYNFEQYELYGQECYRHGIFIFRWVSGISKLANGVNQLYQ